MGNTFSRRTFLTGAAALAGAAAAKAENADPLLDLINPENQAEWSASFDALTSTKQVQTFEPTLSPTATRDVEKALREHASIVNTGGWPKVPVAKRIRIGESNSNVKLLRERLAVSGDIDPAATQSDVFDSYVEAAVKNFQARHGMAADGVVGQLTVSALNVPADVRLRQLETNLDRLKSLSGDLSGRFVMVNVPAAVTEAVERGRISARHTAVLGQIDRQTPILNSAIFQINFNPFWTAPESIIRKDLIPVMQKTPNYLAKNKIRIFDRNGYEVPPEQVNWFSEEPLQYRFRQDPGERNSLGQMRINFQNDHAVYLHDTPDRNLFGRDIRFHSSGCVRVQNIRELAKWLLEDTPGWSRRDIDTVLKSGERKDADMSRPVPLYMTYLTAWGTPSGVVHFRDDVYNLDGLGPIALR